MRLGERASHYRIASVMRFAQKSEVLLPKRHALRDVIFHVVVEKQIVQRSLLP